MATQKDRSYFEFGGIHADYPEIWQRYLAEVPDAHKSNPSEYYYHTILEGSEELRDKLAYEFALFGARSSSPDEDEVMIAENIQSSDYLTKSTILAHFSVNDFFLPDGFIEDHLDTLKDIPIHVVHGTNDRVTLPEAAQRLSAQLDGAILTWVDGGHGSHDPAIKSALIQAMREIYPKS